MNLNCMVPESSFHVPTNFVIQVYDMTLSFSLLLWVGIWHQFIEIWC